MSELHFPNLTIKGFRGIKDLTIPQLGRVNLITGKNNTGKSSILEALRLHTSNADPRIIYNTLEFREEDLSRYDEEEYLTDLECLPHIAPLFHGFPQLLEDFESIEVLTVGGHGPIRLEMRVDSVSIAHDANGGSRLVPSQVQLFEDSDGAVALIVDAGERIRMHRLERFLRFWNTRRTRYSMPRDAPRIPCILVRSHSGERTSGLGNHWDAIALTDMEQEVVEALRIIEPRISAISMIGSERYRYFRRAIVRAQDIPTPVPLRSFGDGMNRLFGIALSLVNAGGGLLLIDEFENGLHYSVQTDVWRMIFKLSKELNIQVFATTHSGDTVNAFQIASAESKEEAIQIKLRLVGEDNVAVVTDKEQLEIATRHDIETR